MSNYGTTTQREEESQALLNGAPVSATQANDTFYGRTVHHVHHHRKRYFALWLLAAVIAVSAVFGFHYYEHNKHHGEDDLTSLGKHHCDSDRSYPLAIVLSFFFGYIGVDRFYLGYVFTGLLKFATAGGFGIWYVIDLVMIIFAWLPDHNGCRLI